MHRHGRWSQLAQTVLEQQADTLPGKGPAIAVSSHLYLQPPFTSQVLPEPASFLLHVPLCRDHATCPGDCSQQDLVIFPHDFPISISLCGGMRRAELQDGLPAGRNLCRVQDSQVRRLTVFSTDCLQNINVFSQRRRVLGTISVLPCFLLISTSGPGSTCTVQVSNELLNT